MANCQQTVKKWWLGGQPNAIITDKGGNAGQPNYDNRSHRRNGEVSQLLTIAEKGEMKDPDNMADIICKQSLNRKNPSYRRH